MSRYIDADLIEDALIEHGQHDKQFKLGEVIKYRPFDVQGIIDKDVPTADVRENVKGEWIIKDDIVPINFMDGYVETERCVCSNCGYEPTYAGRTIFPTTRTLLFCPNCGAQMIRGKMQ